MRGRRWLALGSIVAIALGSLEVSGHATAATPSRGSTGLTGAVLKQGAALQDQMLVESKARLGATLPNVTWSPASATDIQLDTADNYFTAGDLVGMRAASNTEPGVPSLFVSASVANWVRPTNDDWIVQADTFVSWYLDVNNDSTEDYAIGYYNAGGFLHADVVNLNLPDPVDPNLPLFVCNGIPLLDPVTGSYGAYVPWSCFKNPTSVRIYTEMWYSNGGIASKDYVPDTAWVTVASKVKPNKPGTPLTTSAPASLDVTWGAPTAALWPITDYVVQYSLATPIAWKTFADGVSTLRSTRITGLTAGKKYIVRVAAKNNAGTSAFTAASTSRAALAAGIVPSAPGKPVGTPGAGKITVTWPAPAKAGSAPITDYIIEYSTNAGGSWTRLLDPVSTARSAVITGLTPASRVLVRVRAKSFAGVSPLSVNSATLAPFTTPSAPVGLAGGTNNASVNLSWSKPLTTGGGTVDKYRIFYRPAPVSSGPLPSTPQVVNGTTADISNFKWQVRLRINLGGGRFGLCGGSLVDPQWVLTAAHCVDGVVASQLMVHANITLQSNMSNLNGVTVDRIVRDGWNTNTMQNDVALLHLTKTTAGTPIKLWTNPAGPALNTTATVSGWGLTSENGTVVPDQLRTADVKILAAPGNSTCGSYTPNVDFFANEMLCAAGTGTVTDTCSGDSGGPLVIFDGLDFRLAGVTSFGQGCAQASFPGIYARVSNYVRWIQDTVESTWPFKDVACTTASCNTLLTGLTNDVTTELRIRAHTQYGFGTATPLLTTTPAAQVPGAPTNLMGTNDIGGVHLSWSAPASDGGSAIIGYAYSEDGGQNWSPAGTGTSVSFFPTVGSQGTTHTYSVRAVNLIGNGPAATTDVFLTFVAPP